MPIESFQYFIILFRVNKVFTFYHFIELCPFGLFKLVSFKFEMCEIVSSLKIFQISRYYKLNSNKQFISVFKYKITVIVEKLNVTRGRV